MILKKSIILLTLMTIITLNIFAADPDPKAHSAAAASSSSKRGIIIVLNAPSSSGKTSLTNDLIKELNKKEIKWYSQSLDLNAQDEGSEDSYSELDEAQSLSDDERDISVNKDQEQDPNDSMIAILQDMAKLGRNVIYDTVLEQHYIAEFMEKLKIGGFNVYPILIYCSPEENMRRLAERNSRSNTPSLINSDARNPIQPVSQIGQMYKPATESSTTIFKISPKKTLKAIESTLKEEFPVCDDGKILKRQLSASDIERTLHGLKIDLNIVGQEESEIVAITPRYDYALVIDNTNTNKKQALLLLKTFINEKLTKA